MSKYLIVTHQFLPHVSPRTTRWKLLVDELVSLGHEVTVLTGTKQHSEDSNIETIFVGNSRASNVVVSLRNQSNSLDSENRIKSIIFKLLKKILVIHHYKKYIRASTVSYTHLTLPTICSV